MTIKDRRALTLTLVTIFFLALPGCSSHDVLTYREIKPRLDLFTFFAGKSWGRGIVFDRAGRMNRQFIVEINGTVQDGKRLILDEQFVWNDGERSSRIWTIDLQDSAQVIAYSGTAADVRGQAQGKSAGNSLNWRYTLALEVDGKTWDIQFDDWMFLQEGNILFNRAIMRKFGFLVGEVFIVFSKDANFSAGGAR